MAGAPVGAAAGAVEALRSAHTPFNTFSLLTAGAGPAVAAAAPPAGAPVAPVPAGAPPAGLAAPLPFPAEVARSEPRPPAGLSSRPRPFRPSESPRFPAEEDETVSFLVVLREVGLNSPLSASCRIFFGGRV